MSRRPASPRARSAPRVASGSGSARRPAPRAARPTPAGAATRPGGAKPPSRTTVSPPPEVDHESRTVELARLISVRALVFGVVVLVAFSMLFPTVRAYLGQRAELDALAAEVVAAEQAEEDLAAELARWQDAPYVAAQARARLSYVMPGETSYRVIDPEVVVDEPLVAGGATEPSSGPALPVGGAVGPWYATIWDSVRIAGESAVPVEPDAAG